MQIAPNSIAQAIAPETAPASKSGHSGFDATLQAEHSKAQAPPGKEPPIKASPPNPDAKTGGEVANTEPNAQSQKLDSQLKQSAEKDTDSTGSKAFTNTTPGSSAATKAPITIDGVIVAMMPAFLAPIQRLPIGPVSSIVPTATMIPRSGGSQPTSPAGLTIANFDPLPDGTPIDTFTPVGLPIPMPAQPTGGKISPPLVIDIPANTPVLSGAPSGNKFLGAQVVIDPTLALDLGIKKVVAPTVSGDAASTVVAQAPVLNTAVAAVVSEPVVLAQANAKPTAVDNQPALQGVPTAQPESPAVQVIQVAAAVTDNSKAAVTPQQPAKSVKADAKSERISLDPNAEASTTKVVSSGSAGRQLADSNSQAQPQSQAESAQIAETSDGQIGKVATKITANTDAAVNVVSGSQAGPANADAVKEAKPIVTVNSAQADQIIRQTSDRIALLAVARSHEAVTIHLSPPDLGDLTLVVRSAGGKVDADITATNDSVRQALQQHAGQLGHSLSQRGLVLTSVNVGTLGKHSPEGDSTARHNGHAHTNQQQPTNLTLPKEAKTLVGQSLPKASATGVDLRI